jgi:hypothetical protein
MDIKALAKAMTDDQLRSLVADNTGSEEAAAFEAYVGEYEANEFVLNKNS